MRYEWKRASKVFELHKITKHDMSAPSRPMMWDAYYPLGRLRKLKNRNSCKKFVLERYEDFRWVYITLLCMKLDEAKEVAKTVLLSGGHDD